MASTRHPLALSATLLTMALSLGLAACQPKLEAEAAGVEPTVGQKLDRAVAQAETKSAEVKADVKQATAELRSEGQQAANAAGSALKDATITAAVKAKLAADPTLSALRINVDSAAGHVALSGDAPNLTARERATSLALGVDGVVHVDNRLTIRSNG